MRSISSPTTGRVYPLKMVCRVFGVARSSVYSTTRSCESGSQPAPKLKRGPRTEVSDEDLLKNIRLVLSESPFHGEGHRKIRARLRVKGINVGKGRVLRLCGENGLLAPVRSCGVHGNKAHDGTIITQRPDQMWGSDATMFWTQREGWHWFFFSIDHCVQDITGWHASKVGSRFAAMQPILQGVQRHYGAVGKDRARGLALRTDNGPQYTSEAFRGEMIFLGIQMSYAFVGEPQCNGIAERFVRTLKEQCLWVHHFQSLEEARKVIGEFIERYNSQWILERLGYRTPNQARADFLAQKEAA